jgi:hypothetical protein
MKPGLSSQPRQAISGATVPAPKLLTDARTVDDLESNKVSEESTDTFCVQLHERAVRQTTLLQEILYRSGLPVFPQR